ncbi:hypothetical protein ANN_19673 [Periplaneta americana]|uniref:Uncharacterized protein n=1 Tax=Periplaneta americana TaxID=6978 RepID=A0ABQ8SAJ5_PERAM|nr:hypothetical protein ANN_19673 [Periplaneta americana]
MATLCLLWYNQLIMLECLCHTTPQHDNSWSSRATQGNVSSVFGEAMMTPWIEKRLVMQNLPRLIRENIADQLGKNVPETSTTLQGEGANVGVIFVRSKDRKSKIQCSECKRTVCQDHKVSLCLRCKR